MGNCMQRPTLLTLQRIRLFACCYICQWHVCREREREREIGIETAAMSWALSKRGWRVVSSLQGAESPSPFLNLMFSSGIELELKLGC